MDKVHSKFCMEKSTATMQSVTFSSAFSSAPVITLTVEQPYINVTVSAMLQYGTVTTKLSQAIWNKHVNIVVQTAKLDLVKCKRINA